MEDAKWCEKKVYGTLSLVPFLDYMETKLDSETEKLHMCVYRFLNQGCQVASK